MNDDDERNAFIVAYVKWIVLPTATLIVIAYIAAIANLIFGPF